MVSILLDRHCQWNIYVHVYVYLHVECLYICVNILGAVTFTLYICTYNHKCKNSLSLSVSFSLWNKIHQIKNEVGKSVHYSKKILSCDQGVCWWKK